MPKHTLIELHHVDEHNHLILTTLDKSFFSINDEQIIYLTDAVYISLSNVADELIILCFEKQPNEDEKEIWIANANVDVIIVEELPIKSLHVHTGGKFINNKKQNLANSLEVFAHDITFDEEINTNSITLITPLDEDACITFNKNIKAQQLKLETTLVNINAIVATDHALLFSTELEIEEDAKLIVRSISEPSDLAVKKFTNYGQLRLNNTQIISDELLKFDTESYSKLVSCQLFVKDLEVVKGAQVKGRDGYIQADNLITMNGIVKINELTIIAKNSHIAGYVWGGNLLKVQISEQLVVYGLLGGIDNRIRANYLFVIFAESDIDFEPYAGQCIVGKNTLIVNTAITVSFIGGLFGSDVTHKTGAFIGFFTLINAFDYIESTLPYGNFNYYSIYIPHRPKSYWDLLDPGKALRLSYNLLRNYDPRVRIALAALDFGSKAMVNAYHATKSIALAAMHDLTKENDKESEVYKLYAGSAQSVTESVNSTKDKLSLIYTLLSDSSARAEFYNKTTILDLVNSLLELQGYLAQVDGIYNLCNNAQLFSLPADDISKNKRASYNKLNSFFAARRKRPNKMVNDINKALDNTIASLDTKNLMKSMLDGTFVDESKNVSKLPETTNIPTEPDRLENKPIEQQHSRAPSRMKLGGKKGKVRVRFGQKTDKAPDTVKLEHPGLGFAVPRYDFNTNLANLSNNATLQNFHNIQIPQHNFVPPPPVVPVEALKLAPENIQTIKNNLPQPQVQQPLTHVPTDGGMRFTATNLPPPVPSNNINLPGIGSADINTNIPLPNSNIPNIPKVEVPISAPDVGHINAAVKHFTQQNANSAQAYTGSAVENTTAPVDIPKNTNHNPIPKEPRIEKEPSFSNPSIDRGRAQEIDTNNNSLTNKHAELLANSMHSMYGVYADNVQRKEKRATDAAREKMNEAKKGMHALFTVDDNKVRVYEYEKNKQRFGNKMQDIYERDGIIPGVMANKAMAELENTLGRELIAKEENLFFTDRDVISTSAKTKQNSNIDILNDEDDFISLFNSSKSKIIETLTKNNKPESNTQKNSLININPLTATNLEEGIGKSLLIGAGRGFVETTDGLIQLAMETGGLIGLVSDATLRDFNNKIKAEHALYESTPVGKSDAGELGKFGADFLVFSIVPAGVGAKGFKLMSIGAISGGVISGIQPVYHGNLTDRGINTLIGALSGGLTLPVAQAIRLAPRYVLPMFKDRRIINRSIARHGGGNAGKIKEKWVLHQYNRAIDPNIQTPAPVEIYHGYAELNSRQSKLLAELSKTGKSVTIYKSDINVTDLAALTAKTGDEFAMFTLGSRRIVFRGSQFETVIDINVLDKLKYEGWTWSAHTHPGTSVSTLLSSGGDRSVLVYIEQEQSLILNSSGRRTIFSSDGTSMEPSNRINRLRGLPQ